MMKKNMRWVLPAGIEEMLPQEAAQLEHLRREMLDMLSTWGYQLVIPPLVEYLESLNIAEGSDLSRHIFKFVDHHDGRSLGIRADMTTQVARIDASRLPNEGVNRLCYAGPVLLTRARELGGSRGPYQIGAEIYGHDGIDSDLEVMQLMLSLLKTSGQDKVFLDLGHVGVFRGLVQQAGLDRSLETALFDALQRKAKPEIKELLAPLADRKSADHLASLCDLNGDESCLEAAAASLAGASQPVLHALEELKTIATRLKQRIPGINFHFDLAELRGYRYHTGFVFAAYMSGFWQAIAQGGRYNDIGKVFGRSRPATGFSLDLRELILRSPTREVAIEAILAPTDDDADLSQKVNQLRMQGERVIQLLPGEETTKAQCNRQLVKSGGQWVIETIG